MRYDRVTGGVFLSRLSRFSARAIVGGCEQTVHVKNTGRLRELLIPGAEAVLCPSDSPGRKTAYDLVAVRHAASDDGAFGEGGTILGGHGAPLGWSA